MLAEITYFIMSIPESVTFGAWFSRWPEISKGLSSVGRNSFPER